MTESGDRLIARGRSVERVFSFNRTTSGVIVLALGMLALGFVWLRMRMALTILPLNYNEGWNAMHALRFAQTGSPYPPLDTPVVNNYPPFWFALVAAVGSVTGSMISAARLLAALGLCLMVGSAAGIGHALRGRLGAWAAAVAVLFLFSTQAAGYVGIADPQFLAQGLSAFALYLCVRASSPRHSLFLWAVAVSVLAGFIKHNLAALPLALMLASLLDSPRTFARSFAVATGALVVGYLASAAVGGLAWPRHLLSARIYSLGTVVNSATSFLTLNVMGLALAIMGICTLRRQHVRTVFAAFLLFALPIAMGFSGGDGVRLNIYFDTMVIMAVGASLVVTAAAPSARPSAQRIASILPGWAGAAALAMWLMTSSLYHVRDVEYGLRHDEPLDVRVARFADDVAYLKSIPGDAICADLSMCYYAGKSFIYDPFNAEQALRTNAITTARVRELVVPGLRVIHLGPGASDQLRITVPFSTEIAEFEVTRTNADGQFLRKRGS